MLKTFCSMCAGADRASMQLSFDRMLLHVVVTVSPVFSPEGCAQCSQPRDSGSSHHLLCIMELICSQSQCQVHVRHLAEEPVVAKQQHRKTAALSQERAQKQQGWLPAKMSEDRIISAHDGRH